MQGDSRDRNTFRKESDRNAVNKFKTCEAFKSRLVVQLRRINSGRRFNAVAHIGSVRVVLAFANGHGWPIGQIHVSLPVLWDRDKSLRMSNRRRRCSTKQTRRSTGGSWGRCSTLRANDWVGLESCGQSVVQQTSEKAHMGGSKRRCGSDSTYSRRTKHIALRFFYLREVVASNKIVTCFDGTDKMLADICTKCLNKEKLMEAFAQIKKYRE